MYILNTTYLVSDKMYGVWYKWLYEQHIPFMLESGFFTTPQIAKVLLMEPQDGTSYSVQFYVADIQTLERWNAANSDVFAEHFQRKFGEDVLFFSTVLEVLT